MATIAERLRERREAVGLTQGQVAQYEGVQPQYISQLERGANSPPAWPLLARLAQRYRTTTDYLLGMTDDPDPRRDAPLPPAMREVISLGEHWAVARQEELLAHARVLDEAQRADNLAAYDQVLAAFRRLGGPELATAVETLLRADAAGDVAMAQRLFDDLLARYGSPAQEPPDEAPK